MLYDQYNAAKRALATSNDACRRAEKLAKETADALAGAGHLLKQCGGLRRALEEQHAALSNHHDSSLLADKRESEQDFDTLLEELDRADGELNSALAILRSTALPDALDDAPQSSPSPAGQKTLFEFADDQAIESLRHDLRDTIDDMHDAHQELQEILKDYLTAVKQFRSAIDSVPPTPLLEPPARLPQERHDAAYDLHRSSQRSASSSATSSSQPAASAQIGGSATALTDSGRPIALSSSQILAIYSRSQNRHLDQMAALLLSLSQHFDHCALLIRDGSDPSMPQLPPDEIVELQEVVAEDAANLDDVTSEVDARLAAIEMDCERARSHIASLEQVRDVLTSVQRDNAQLNITLHADRLNGSADRRAAVREDICSLRDSLNGLTDHYTRFGHAFDALCVEVDRRRRYELSISALLAGTRTTAAQLAAQERLRRSTFLERYAPHLPSDIWRGISRPPRTPLCAFLPDDLDAQSLLDKPESQGDGDDQHVWVRVRVPRTHLTAQLHGTGVAIAPAQVQKTRSTAGRNLGDSHGVISGSGSSSNNNDDDLYSSPPSRIQSPRVPHLPAIAPSLPPSAKHRYTSAFIRSTPLSDDHHHHHHHHDDKTNNDNGNDDNDDDDEQVEEEEIVGIPRLPQTVIDKALARLRL
ncbi:hypothetical protein PYCC9005_000425 [Savitreella phatthalungensis]